jgi:hypothetical protein
MPFTPEREDSGMTRPQVDPASAIEDGINPDETSEEETIPVPGTQPGS